MGLNMESEEKEDSLKKSLQLYRQMSNNSLSSKIDDNNGYVQNNAITSFKRQNTYNQLDIGNSFNDNSSHLATSDDHSISKYNSDNRSVYIKRNVGNRTITDARVNVEVSGGNLTLNNVTFNNCQVLFNNNVRVKVQRRAPSLLDLLFKEGYRSDDE
ncbi:MAG: hypothetical protein ABIG11_07915 [bacterium]